MLYTLKPNSFLPAGLRRAPEEKGSFSNHPFSGSQGTFHRADTAA